MSTMPLPDLPRLDCNQKPNGDASCSEPIDRPIKATDFWAYMPAHAYIFTPTGELWPAVSVNSRCKGVFDADGMPYTKQAARKKKGETVFENVPIQATEWLDENRAVEQMTWAPGAPAIVENRLVSGGGWIEREGCRTFNLYQPPRTLPGDPGEAGPWISHLARVFPNEAEHITFWLAHRVQKPGEKINHALVLGGNQGVGKDTLLEPVKYAIGPWNFSEVSPVQLIGRFNGFVKSVILRVSEARDLGEVDRYAFYEHMKVYTAAPPDVLRCDEKNIREHAVMNVCGVVMTTNNKTNGIYLPGDDRRHFVAWSNATKDEFSPQYWRDLYFWYHNENGIGHVAAYLRSLDLSQFDPKQPPPKTAAFRDIVDSSRSSEDAELSDVIEGLGNPSVTTLARIANYPAIDESFRTWLLDRRNSRQIPHRLEAAGYVAVRNDADKTDGRWKIDGKRQVIYGRRELSVHDRMAAATALIRGL